jgi:hypothetical protein
MTELYWKKLIQLTDERIVELTLVASRRNLQGSALRWIQGMIETNKTWKLIAEDRLGQITRYKEHVASLKDIAVRTFRGNDD